jgi:hypothetical protein
MSGTADAYQQLRAPEYSAARGDFAAPAETLPVHSRAVDVVTSRPARPHLWSLRLIALQLTGGNDAVLERADGERRLSASRAAGRLVLRSDALEMDTGRRHRNTDHTRSSVPRR